jgi:hypothetical protein
VIGIVAVIGTIVVGIQVAKVNKDLGHLGRSSSSNCLSQSGTDPGCCARAYAGQHERARF